ncbi:MAG: Sensor protein, partial [uncultured bacterium]
MKNKTTNFNFSHHYAIVVFMITLFVFMSGINIFLIDYQKKHFINEKKEHIEDSLELVGLILKEKILKREYYAIEDIILNWETDYIFILSLNVVARNGNILASRGSQISSSNVWKISREIFEGDSLIFTINAVIDLTPFDKQEKSLILRFLLISFILTLLLGLILWQIFRKLALDRLKSEVLHRIDAEKQTRQWNDFLTLIIESLTYPFYVIDLTTHKIIIANKASGWDGKNPNITCYQLTHNKDVPCYGSEHSCPIELVKKTKAPVVLEHVHFNSKGELRNMEVHGFPIFDSFGNLVKMIEYSIDISEKKLLEVQLKESREYFQKVTQYTQSGVIIVNANLLNITDANRYAYAFLGCSYSELLGSSITDFFSSNSLKGIISHERFNLEKTEDCICKTKTRGEVKVRLTISYLQLHQDDHLLLNFIDISDIHELLDKQNINIQLAKNVLSLVNSENPRYVHISDSSHLFFDYLSIPFHKEGGDHFFVRTLEKTSGTKDLRTFISLKDQSGHEVNCVLKSIITDLIHHSVISNNSDSSLEEILFELNNNILNSFMLPEDGFMTAFSAEINHETLNLKYASCG